MKGLSLLFLCFFLLFVVHQPFKYTNLEPNASETIFISEKAEEPLFITGELTAPSSKNHKDILFQYLDSKKELLKFENSSKESFFVVEQFVDPLGYSFFRLQQVYNNIPVFGARITAHVGKNGVLNNISGTIIPDLEKKLKLKQNDINTQQKAMNIAENHLWSTLNHKPIYEDEPKVELVVYSKGNEANYVYMIHFDFYYPELGNWIYFVDTLTGDILSQFNHIHSVQGENTVGIGIGGLGHTRTLNTVLSSDSKYYLQDNSRGKGIITYDGLTTRDPFFVLWQDHDNIYDSNYDAAAVDAHFFTGVVYDYYKEVFDRDSIDNKGAIMRVIVHDGYNGARSTGGDAIFFGDYSQNGIPLSSALDIVAHEYTHGLIGMTAGLFPTNHSGAINESISDIFATLIEFHENQNPDWFIGEDVFPPYGIRNMSDPIIDHYSKYNEATGIHYNAGISNKAAYLISEGGYYSDIIIDGIGKEKLGDIFYRTLTQYLNMGSTFQHLRTSVIQSAKDLYGEDSKEVSTVTAAFDAVGVPSFTWVSKAPMPTERNQLGITALDGKIYAVGGSHNDKDLNTHEIYYSETNTWVSKANMPTARSDLGVVAVDGKIYAIGGKAGNLFLNTVEQYNPRTNTWNTKTSMPTARSGFGIAIVDEKIYVIGGTNGNPSNKVEVYDPKTDTWTKKANMPAARKHLQAVDMNGKIYIIGGTPITNSFDYIYNEYNPKTDTWQIFNPNFIPKYHHSALSLDNKLYSFGGVNDEGDILTAEEYELVTMNLEYDMPIPMKKFGLAKIDKTFYLIGDSFHFTARFE
ncbi:M4 family metallopeptidase [Chengkuizengella marina]|uniref:Bacillolysin n=1 Tax=Chengkuizengella marina TaxID=2507566 RepID=A0A6N9Q2B5_9BACL|nr:M4 family metallopeptidase [Chengkuizengella marina]NBI28228.1 hypothetical protein [Chengkuizengella marina]